MTVSYVLAVAGKFRRSHFEAFFKFGEMNVLNGFDCARLDVSHKPVHAPRKKKKRK